MKTLPKQVKFIKYHWRHCAIFDPANNNKHVFEASQQFGHEHAFPNDPTPEVKCKAWLKENGYTFQASEANQREVWVQP